MFSFLNITSGKIIYVDDDGGKEYTTIQSAIDSAEVGDTIFVYSGIYYESLLPMVSIKLVGENTLTTIIDGSKGEWYEKTISVNLNDITIKNFTIKNSYGLWIWGNNLTITDNIVENTSIAVEIVDSKDSIIARNIIKNSSMVGINLEELTESSVINNTISNSDFGISIDYYSSNNLIENNIISLCKINGIRLRDSSNDNNVRFNTIKNSNHGIYIYKNCVNNQINNNIFENNVKDTVRDSEETPGFELIFILIAVALVLFWKRRRI